MYRRILLAYDGTLEGRTALREGAILSRETGAELFLLAVISEVGGYRLAEAATAGAGPQMRERYRAIFQEAVQALEALGFTSNARMVRGEPVQEIAAYAREISADLVVVGHHRRGMLGRWWAGASGANLSDFLDCSLLIGRHDVEREVFEAALRRAVARGPDRAK